MIVVLLEMKNNSDGWTQVTEHTYIKAKKWKLSFKLNFSFHIVFVYQQNLLGNNKITCYKDRRRFWIEQYTLFDALQKYSHFCDCTDDSLMGSKRQCSQGKPLNFWFILLCVTSFKFHCLRAMYLSLVN